MRTLIRVSLAACLTLAFACKKEDQARPSDPPATTPTPPAPSTEPAATPTPSSAQPDPVTPSSEPSATATTTAKESGATVSGAHKGHRHEPSDPYYCPMHPDETAKEAGATCPICKMELVPRRK